jgi:hypothetical protein
MSIPVENYVESHGQPFKAALILGIAKMGACLLAAISPSISDGKTDCTCPHAVRA